jgi:hypothetical protein
MGGGFNSRTARQFADLTFGKSSAGSTDDTGGTETAIRAVVLSLLAFDGVISAVAAALLLPSYVGSVPIPVSALLSGLVNAALVWAAMQWTESARLAALPLWTWLLTVAALTLGGPGGDIVFGGRGIMAFAFILLIIFGAGPPAWLLWRRQVHPP